MVKKMITKETIIDLPDLTNEVRKIWNGADKWRSLNGEIQFHLSSCDGGDHWFSIYQAPEKVEDFVRRWEKLGGANVRD